MFCVLKCVSRTTDQLAHTSFEEKLNFEMFKQEQKNASPTLFSLLCVHVRKMSLNRKCIVEMFTSLESQQMGVLTGGEVLSPRNVCSRFLTF